MPFNKSDISQRPATSWQEIRHILLEEISSGAFTAGQKLPTERDLAARFDVSRTIVREALTSLETGNQIVRQVGRGTFVGAAGQDPFNTEQPTGTSPIKLIEARQAIESELVALAVLNATESDLQRIGRACEALEKATSLVDFELLDGEFHAAIAESTHNELLFSAYRLISQARDHPDWRRLKQKRHTARPERRLEVYREHRQIMDALIDRDTAAAKDAMLEHLSRVRANLLGR